MTSSDNTRRYRRIPQRMISESVLKKTSVLSLELSHKVKDNLTRNDVNKFASDLMKEAKKNDLTVLVFKKSSLN